MLSPNITELDTAAFQSTGATGSFSFANLTTLGESVFASCDIYSVDFTGSTFTTVEINLFYMNVDYLHHVIFPATVTAVKKNCFYNCQHLSYIVFPTTSTISWQSNENFF